MPQGIKGWAIWLAAQALLTLALKLVVKLVDNALISWGDDTIAAWLGITSPSSSTVFNWGLPFALAAVALWFYHYFTARPLQKALAERSGGDRFSATGTVGNGLPDRTWIRRVEPTTLIIGGLIGIAVFAICAAVGLIIWQQSRPTAPVVATNIQLGAPPDLEGSPLAWESAPYLGWQKQSDGRIDARTIAIRGKNIGKEEVQLTDAYIVSGITGKRLSMTIFGRNPDGTGSMTLPKDTYPIPPDAPMQLSTDELNGTTGIPEVEFLKEWGTMYFIAEYNGEKHRVSFDRPTMESLFVAERPKPTPPHVARRQ